MSRPILLVFLLIVLIITSQFEWKQQLVSDTDASAVISKKQLEASRTDVVKEKIILSQEKNIQRLNEHVSSLLRQLRQCKGSNETMNDSIRSLTENVIELERLQILED